jgi:hypothetical protein
MAAQATGSTGEIDELKSEVAQLRWQVERLEAIAAVERLQNAYGFYLDTYQGEARSDLFTDDAELHFLGGIFRGRDGVRRFHVEHAAAFVGLYDGGQRPPTYGRMGEHAMLERVITVADDNQSARARVRHWLLIGKHDVLTQGPDAPDPAKPDEVLQWYEGGLYENVYVKENGVWKIKVMDYNIVWAYTPEVGWAHTPVDFRPTPLFTKTYPEDPVGPDELEDPPPTIWPDRPILPFHYPHPITGKEIHPVGERPSREQRGGRKLGPGGKWID